MYDLLLGRLMRREEPYQVFEQALPPLALGQLDLSEELSDLGVLFTRSSRTFCSLAISSLLRSESNISVTQAEEVHVTCPGKETRPCAGPGQPNYRAGRRDRPRLRCEL